MCSWNVQKTMECSPASWIKHNRKGAINQKGQGKQGGHGGGGAKWGILQDPAFECWSKSHEPCLQPGREAGLSALHCPHHSVPACPRFALDILFHKGNELPAARHGQEPCASSTSSQQHCQPAIILQDHAACPRSLLDAKLLVINKHGPNNSLPDLARCRKQPQKRRGWLSSTRVVILHE